jgi:2-oxo-4-hydroxy-4-carboxy-5-ureidoimidazoline decarboxylase
MTRGNPMPTTTISQLNALDDDAAVAVIGGIFELSSWIVRETWPQRPFASVEALHAALCETIRNAGTDRQLDLIRAHPDLVGHAARAGTLTRESTGEQRAAGLGPDDLTRDDIETFSRSNAAYKEKFGFPFIICARENHKASILAAFPVRLAHDIATERETALREVERIGWYRLIDLVDNDPIGQAQRE